MSVVGALACVGLVALADPEPTPFRHTLFVQFDGAELTWVPTPEDENAALGTSFLALFEGSVLPAYDGSETDRLAVVQAVRSQLSGLGVRVVDQRPPDHLPYTMAVVGGDWQNTAATQPTRGVAPQVDCARANQRHVVFAFVGSDEPSVQQATTISQEAAHAWGLDHVLGTGLIMSYDFAAPDAHFSDGCVDLCEDACQGPGTVFCRDEHAAWCPDGLQDSHAELLGTFGDDTPDQRAPTVSFTTPDDGDRIPPGEPVTVEVEVSDDYGGVGWRFELRFEGEVVAVDRQTAWPLTNLPEGHYAATVEALDHADHSTSVTIEFDVGDAAGSTGGLGEASGTGSSGGLDSSGTGNETGEAAAGSEPADGCTCTTQPGAWRWAWLGLLLAPSLRRRLSRPLRTSS